MNFQDDIYYKFFIAVLVATVALAVFTLFDSKDDRLTNKNPLKTFWASEIQEDGFHISYFRQNKIILDGYLGLEVDTNNPEVCGATKKELCWQWKTGVRLQMNEFLIAPNVRCLKKVWIASHYQDVLKDCFLIKEAKWYGGGEFFGQVWPIQSATRHESAFITGDMLQNKEQYYGGVMERLWFNSEGVSIWVDESVPLFVSLNSEKNGSFCLIGKNKSPYISYDFAPPTLQYAVCIADSMITSYQQILWKFFEVPVAIPDKALFQYPIWSTWAQFHSQISQDLVLSFATNITYNNFSRSILEIDDKWENCYGDMEFDKERFPDPKSMIAHLHSLGFYVSLWVHPFSNYECSSYKEGNLSGFWVKNSSGIAGEVSWWNGKGGLLDVTNPFAVDWWSSRLKRLQDTYGVDTFKFDAGEATWLPENCVLNGSEKLQPNIYSTKYVELASQFGSMAEIRVGHRTQKHNLFVRILDRDSTWGEDNGLRTVIPTVLLFGVLGYSFILPDMIGGNAYKTKPDKELYIRWMQLNIFLPAMQFSIVPWQYDDQVLRIAENAIEMHENLLPLFLGLAKEATETGAPIIRPMWWKWSEDPVTYNLSSQFMVGDVYLVAPVLEPKAEKRDIYLPKGLWKDEINGNLIEGTKWLMNYNVKLEEIPHFVLLIKSS